jgi:hypothetical protein
MSISMRKPRLQGPLNNLEEHQKQQLHAWFREGLTHNEIKKRMMDKFKIRTHESSLSNYYNRHSEEIIFPHSPISVETREVRVIIHIEIRPELITPAAPITAR